MHSITAFAVVFPLLFACPTSAKPPGSTSDLIISFHEYRESAHHVKFVENVLGVDIKWTERVRTNRMTGLATDFIVIGVKKKSMIEAVKKTLVQRDEVKNVFSQGVHKRSLLAQEKDSQGELSMVKRWDNGKIGRGASVLGSNVSLGANRKESIDMPGVDLFGAEELWRKGFHGSGVRVAVFDTGLNKDNPHFRNVVERTDWTEEKKFDDEIGHGTFVAGLIAGSHPICPGLARDAQIVTFRVFDGNQISYTSWFLDAFNYAMHADIDVLNLSIGGPDFADEPFTEKINELSAAGVIVVSAIGNDGPLWGSLNNPADMMEVVGVGGVEPDGRIASFSSRGMTTHELGSLRLSYGRVKPDLVAYGRALTGPSNAHHGRCKKLSGTSVASPVVAGAIALIASTVPKHRRKVVVNPASVKRALLQSTKRLRGSSMYEQGNGLLDIPGAAKVMKEIDDEFIKFFAGLREDGEVDKLDHMLQSRSGRLRSLDSISENQSVGVVPGPKAVLFPSFLDLSSQHCTFMWPHCAQPLYVGATPVIVNITILNPSGVKGIIDKVEWVPGSGGDLLHVNSILPERFWPWAGGLGVHLRARTSPVFSPGLAEGRLSLRIRSVIEGAFSDVELPIRAEVINTPKRENRVLFDVFHSLKYPPGYVPRDTLSQGKDVLDWLGDHPHTNFHALFRQLRRAGYFVEILSTPLSCLPDDTPSHYGALLLIDSEDFFSPSEIRTVARFVKAGGMTLVVAAEWHNNDIMQDIRFEDDNTRSWWTPIVGGGNVPAINKLLHPHGIAFGDKVVSGKLFLDSHSFNFVSGTNIVSFPRGGEVLYGAGMRIHKPKSWRHHETYNAKVPVLGICKSGSGTVVAFGDSNCIDTTEKEGSCYSTFVELLRHAIVMAQSQSYRKKSKETVVLRCSLTANSMDRIATPYSTITRDLFLPHSRTFKMMKNLSYGGTLRSICGNFESLVVQPSTNLTMRSLSPISLPSVEYALPLGSPDSYYKRGHGGRRRSYFNLRVDESTGGVTVMESSLKSSMRSTLFTVEIVAGVLLLVVSLAIRLGGRRMGAGFRRYNQCNLRASSGYFTA